MLYRNLLAMETEELLRSYPADGAVLMGGCDKTTPALIGRAGSDEPADHLHAGGPMRDAATTGQVPGVGFRTPGNAGRNCAPATSPRPTGGTWKTASRRSPPLHDHGNGLHHDQRHRVLGLPPVRRVDPGARLRRRADGHEHRQAIVEMVGRTAKPTSSAQSRSTNAVTAVLGLGGSTNSIVHLVAWPRRHRRHHRPLRRTGAPDPGAGQPAASGAFLMEDFYAGGCAPCSRNWATLDRHQRMTAATARPWRRTSKRQVYRNADVIRPRDNPLVAGGAWRCCAATWRPRRGHQRAGGDGSKCKHTGRAVVFKGLQRHERAHRRPGAGHRRRTAPSSKRESRARPACPSGASCHPEEAAGRSRRAATCRISMRA